MIFLRFSRPWAVHAVFGRVQSRFKNATHEPSESFTWFGDLCATCTVTCLRKRGHVTPGAVLTCFTHPGSVRIPNVKPSDDVWCSRHGAIRNSYSLAAASHGMLTLRRRRKPPLRNVYKYHESAVRAVPSPIRGRQDISRRRAG